MKNSLCLLIACVVTFAVFTSGSVFGQAGSISSVVASYPSVIVPPNAQLGDLNVSVVASASTTTAPMTAELAFELEQKGSLGKKVVWIVMQPTQGGTPDVKPLGVNSLHNWSPHNWDNVDYGGLPSGDYRIITSVSDKGPPIVLLAPHILNFNKP